MNYHLKYLIGLFVAPLLFISTLVARGHQNVIVIFTDDQGYQDMGVYGSPNLKTPHLDRMASEGMRFTDFYSAASVCTPSRAALLTGSYPERVGDMGVLFPKARTGLNPDETTIAEMLKAKCYATACIGKWHLGHLEEFLPTSQGFDYYYGIPYSNDMTIAQDMRLSPDLELREGVTRETIWQPKKNWVPLMRNTEVIEYPADQEQLTKRYTEEAIRFIETNREQPFFLYLPHTMPHVPLYASDAFRGKSRAGLYGDTIEEIDWSVGQILDAVRDLELHENTLVVFTSDNGPWYFPQNATAKKQGNMNRRVGGSAEPLRGYKFKQYEGGMRVPAIFWGPGRVPAGTVSKEVASTIDLLPTIAELTGADLPELKIDGKSILPLLKGQDGAKSPHEAYFYRKDGVRVGKWKLIYGELYNLSDDLSETTNVADQNPEVLQELSALLEKRNQEISKERRWPGRK